MFEKYLKEANLTKQDFINLFDFVPMSLYKWSKANKYPHHLQIVLELMIKAQRYQRQDFTPFDEENKNDKDKAERTLLAKDIKRLESENQRLKEQIKQFVELKKLFLELEQENLKLF